MNINLIRKTFKDKWKSILYYSLGLFSYAVFTTAIYPQFSDIKGLDGVYKNMQPFMRMFGAESKFNMRVFSSYVSVEFLGVMYVIIAAAFVIGFARQMVAGELQEGTLELLMSQPIERWKVLASKVAVLFAGITILSVVTSVTIIVLAAAFDIEVTYLGFLYYIPLSIAFMFAIGGYSVFFSTLLKRPRQVAAAASGVTVVFYMINFAYFYIESVDWMKYFSLFYYFNVETTISSGQLPVRNILVLTGVAVVFIAAAFVLFQRKDIA